MASLWPVLFLFFITMGIMVAAWFATPKGPQQTLLRTSFLLTLVCCYLMWAITYMAQLHPLL
ncbi:ATPase, V0 complex, subunit E1/e2, partial [Hysterangium stoloniferum]